MAFNATTSPRRDLGPPGSYTYFINAAGREVVRRAREAGW